MNLLSFVAGGAAALGLVLWGTWDRQRPSPPPEGSAWVRELAGENRDLRRRLDRAGERLLLAEAAARTARLEADTMRRSVTGVSQAGAEIPEGDRIPPQRLPLP